MTNKTLRNARVAKKDEFYTQYSDIEKELVNYKGQLRGKTVYCNCDNPDESNFVKYFTDNFTALGLKKLIATHYIDPQTTTIKPHKLVLTQTANADGFISEVSTLYGDGDFRSEECLSLLSQSDIVVTNPPFSIWREFAELIISNNKYFVAMGTIQAANYTAMLDGIIAGTVQAGYTNYNKSLKFVVPEHYESKKIIDGKKVVEVPVCWWTNLSVTNRKPIQLNKHYTPEVYPKYESRNTKGKPTESIVYDAINVDRVADIPYDYEGLMGVPVTLLGKIDYNQFEVLGKINNGFICGRKVFTRLIIKRKIPVAIKEQIDKPSIIRQVEVGNIIFNNDIYMGQGGDAVGESIRQEVEDLSFALWQQSANEKAYERGLITQSMYEYAKSELHRIIESLSSLCYTPTEV